MDKIKHFITDDLQWKVLSVILAVVLWFVCINVDNPTMSNKDTLLLEIKGLDVLTADKKMLLNESTVNSTTVSVKVRGKAAEVSNLRGKLNAYIDLSVFDVIGAGQTGVPLSTLIHVEKLGNYDFDILEHSPEKVEVTIDRRITLTKSISLDDDGTIVAEGYAYTTPIIEPATVQVTGAETQISKIKTMSVPVDLTDATETIYRTERVRAYDSDGKELSVDISTPQVSVTVPISKVGKAPVSKPTYTGKPAEGFAVSSVEYDLKELEIMGSKEDVEAFVAGKIKLTPVDIEGKTATQRATQDLRTSLTGTKLNLVNNTPYECNIIIRIEPLVTKTLIIPMEEIEKNGYTLGAQIISTEVEVEVEGLQRDIDALTKLAVSVNLSGLMPGNNAVAVDIAPAAGITIKRQTETVDILVAETAVEE